MPFNKIVRKYIPFVNVDSLFSKESKLFEMNKLLFKNSMEKILHLILIMN